MIFIEGCFCLAQKFPCCADFFSGKNPGLLAPFWRVPGKMCC